MSSTKNQAVDAGSVNLIGKGTEITGDINSLGDVRIDGILKGNLITKGKFVLGPNGSIIGNVKSQNADLSGEVTGTVEVEDMLSLKASSKITGDILTGKLSIEPGAIFSGNCSMGAKVKNMVQNEANQNANSKSA
ncbi:MAG: polymer-forming cytoskeletal protein [Bacteroidia bacterium]|nr:polymer-forming cytoskeletal protein [Bacteroidia bacterium]